MPLSSITYLIDLQQIHGVDLGNLYHNDDGVREMTLTIAEKMKSKIVEHLRITNNPFSLIIDG